MKSGPISVNTHAMLEPIVAVLLIAAPWIFGFSDVSEATTVSIAVGAVMLVAGSMTQWRYALLRLIPLRMHFMTDLLLGILLIASPFVLGFSDESGATWFLVIVGALELLTAVSTRWDPAETETTGGIAARA